MVKIPRFTGLMPAWPIPVAAVLLTPAAQAVPASEAQVVAADAHVRRFDAAARSLDGKAECVSFRWERSDDGNERAAITVPVTMNGKAMRLQFDTGADTHVLYGSVSDNMGWSEANAASFRPAVLQIGATRLDRPYVHLMRSIVPEGVDGTLGLPALIGRISVIDYPGKRLCLFHEADLPSAVRGAATFIGGSLHDGKLFLPASTGDSTVLPGVMLDTGSSAMPLTVDLRRWLNLTGFSSPDAASATIAGMAWGKPIRFAGAPVASPLLLGGKIDLGRPLVFVQPADRDSFKSYGFALDAVLGNAALWDSIVVLQLTGRTDIGFVRPAS